MNNEGIKQLEDLFDLGDSKEDLEDIYNEDVGASTFEEKINDLHEILEDVKEEKITSTKDTIQEAISSTQDLDNKEVISEKESEKVEEKTEEEEFENTNIVEVEDEEKPLINDEEIDFDTTESFKVESVEKEEINEKTKPSIEGKVEKVEMFDKVLTEEEVKEKYEESKSEAKLISEKEMNSKVHDDEKSLKCNVEQHKSSQSTNYWQLTHPDAKFTHFYKMKKERLEKFLADGEVPYNAWKEELVKARVDLSSLVFDLDHLSKQMQQVQQYQYRVAEIRMGVIGQYNWCKRSLEFLRGKLAQIAYERPIEKFNGVVYDHLSDIEDYLQQLEVLKDNSEIVTKNLDKAAEVISRRVTVVMMEVKTDNKGTRYIPREGEEQEDLGGYSVAQMTPANLSSNIKEEIKEEDPDDEFIDECDVFEVNSSIEEKKPKKGWGIIPSSKE